MGKLRITEQNSDVHILQRHLPADKHKEFYAKYKKDMVVQIKTEIYIIFQAHFSIWIAKILAKKRPKSLFWEL